MQTGEYQSFNIGLHRYFVILLLYFDANVRHIVKLVVSKPGSPPDFSLRQWSERETGSWTQHIRARAMNAWQRHIDEARASSRARSPSALLSARWCCRKEERGISHHATLLIPPRRTDWRTDAVRSQRSSELALWQFLKMASHQIELNIKFPVMS